MMIVAEGKTKVIYGNQDYASFVDIFSKDDITAGDGERHSIIPGKGALATTTTCNVFDLLEKKHIPTHFMRRVDAQTFRAQRLKMIPIEIVGRRITYGSYLARNPHIPEGKRIEGNIVTELYLKNDKLHDPFIRWNERKRCFDMYHARQPIAKGYFGRVPKNAYPNMPASFKEVCMLYNLLFRAFAVLELEWERLGVVLVDLKIECGYTPKGKIVIGDVIDNDSWRIWPDGDKKKARDKDTFRRIKEPTEKDLRMIRDNYQWVADRTDTFVH